MYVILELQTNADGTVGSLVSTYEDRNAAESKYHTVLAAAAISNLPKHTAFMLTNDGSVMRRECYEHEQEEPNEG